MGEFLRSGRTLRKGSSFINFSYYLCVIQFHRLIALIMKRSFILIFLTIIVLSGCKKDETPSLSGTVTIDNKIYQSTTYYAYGFLFSKAKKVSTLDTPGPDVTLFVITGGPANRLTFQVSNLNPSFYKLGDYPDAQSASAAFDDLATVGNYQWTEMADPVIANQVWVYRTGTETYAKMRIISIVNEIRDDLAYGACSFEWVYQPDGSKTFPVK